MRYKHLGRTRHFTRSETLADGCLALRVIRSRHCVFLTISCSAIAISMALLLTRSMTGPGKFVPVGGYYFEYLICLNSSSVDSAKGFFFPSPFIDAILFIIRNKNGKKLEGGQNSIGIRLHICSSYTRTY